MHAICYLRGIYKMFVNFTDMIIDEILFKYFNIIIFNIF